MSWRKSIALLLVVSNSAAAGDYVLGGGIEGDSEDGLAASLIADLALSEHTWLSGSVAHSSVDPPNLPSTDTWYGDLGIDHWFDPVGVRAGAAYWGDSDILDSNDWLASVYWRTDAISLSADYEYRDFSFSLPMTNMFPGRTLNFDANGFGLSARFNLTDDVSLSLSGMDYDYSDNLSLADNNRILDLLSFSRLSLINSLVDYSARATLGLNVGDQRWEFEAGTWKGEVDGGTTTTATIRFLTPLSEASDIEFGLGYDDSDLYGGVTFFSVYLYFYGAGQAS